MFDTYIPIAAVIAGAILGFIAYFLPTIIGEKRDIPRLPLLFVVNATLAWIPVIWLVCLLWAILREPRSQSASGEDPGGGDYRACPQCAEPVRAAAVHCRFCGHKFTPRLVHSRA